MQPLKRTVLIRGDWVICKRLLAVRWRKLVKCHEGLHAPLLMDVWIRGVVKIV